MKFRRSPFAALQAAADARNGDVEAAAAAARRARDAYEAHPSPQTHAALGRAIGALSVAVDPDGVTDTSRLWRKVLKAR